MEIWSSQAMLDQFIQFKDQFIRLLAKIGPSELRKYWDLTILTCKQWIKVCPISPPRQGRGRRGSLGTSETRLGTSETKLGTSKTKLKTSKMHLMAFQMGLNIIHFEVSDMWEPHNAMLLHCLQGFAPIKSLATKIRTSNSHHFYFLYIFFVATLTSHSKAMESTAVYRRWI